jgi:hypothetical protein
MITSFQVGAVFKIINEASPALAQILRQVRELNAAIDKARANLATLGKSVMPASLTTAVAETGDLAKAWGDVAKNATIAQRAIGGASAAAVRSAGTGAAAASTAGGGGIRGGGGRHRPGWLGGGGTHITGPGAPIPGGSHVRLGGGAMAAAFLMGYGAYEAAQMEDAVFQLIYHSGTEQNDANRARFRKILQDSMSESGYSLHDVAESAKQEIRMFQGTPGGGIDVLPEMLRAATIESRLKGESPEESMRALIGLAHMTKQYSPEAIKKLAPAFAFLSTANPASLGSIERAAGYAVPLLQSGLEIDPMQSLLLGTALTRAGATNTKSGTWLREMALRAMPGTSLMSKIAFKKHEEALRTLGLVDEENKPTWFTDGKPDLLKMLDIAGSRAAAIPVEKRASYERQLFGAQGGGGFALLADPAVREQILNLQREMNSPEFKNRYASFTETYKEGSTVQQARTAMADFNITMMELGKNTLPAVNMALHDFKSVLEGLRGMLPGGNGQGLSTVGGRAIEGAVAGLATGAAVGALGGPFGASIGALGGAVAGGAVGAAEAYMKQQGAQQDKKETDEFVRALRDAGTTGTAGSPKQVTMAPISLSLNIDGRTLAEAMSTALMGMYGFPQGAPAADGMSQFYSGDHNYPDK